MNNEDIITELGIGHLTPAQQQRVIDELDMRVGEAAVQGLSSEQLHEYEAIINGHQEVISNWLEENDPHYTDTVIYQQLAQGFESDPEKVPADKVYASMAWVEKNSPNLGQAVAAIKDDIKSKLVQQQ